MAAFLSYNEWKCGHEQAILLRSISDMQYLFSLPYTGTVETASAQGWRIIKHYAPQVRHAVVLRPIEDVVESMVKTAEYDVPRLRRVMSYGDRMLRELAQQPGVLTLNYSDLDTERGCRWLFEHCLPYHFNPGWWREMRDKNIQCSVPAYIQYYHENKPKIEAFKSLLWKELRRLRRDNLITRH